MRSYKTEGIVIKRRNFGEADRLLTVFSKYHGKIQIKAVGVRKINSRRSPHIELLNYSSFNLYRGKNMSILTEVNSLNNFPNLKNDLNKIAASYHICELMDGLCAENQENEEIFELLVKTLNMISNDFSLRDSIYAFEIKLLSILGFHNHVESDARINTQSVIEEILERKLKTRQILLQFTS